MKRCAVVLSALLTVSLLLGLSLNSFAVSAQPKIVEANKEIDSWVRQLHDADPKKRSEAVSALRKIGTPEVVSHLARAFEDEVPQLRRQAIGELTELAVLNANIDKQMVFALVAPALKDGSTEVRCTALMASVFLAGRPAASAPRWQGSVPYGAPSDEPRTCRSR